MTDQPPPDGTGGPGYSGPPPTEPYAGPYAGPYGVSPWGGQPYPGPWGAPPPGYGYPGPYGYAVPLVPVRPRCPGLVVAAGVLGYVESAILLLSSLFVVAFADDPNRDYSSLGWAAFANLLAAALLIGGGIMASTGKALGRASYLAGVAVVVGAGIFWTTWWDDGAGTGLFVSGLFVVPLLIGAAMIWNPEANRWFTAMREPVS